MLELDVTPLVLQDEILFRQAHPKGDPLYIDPSRTELVHFNLFLPSKADHDGLSLIRPKFRALKWAAYRTEKPSVRYLVVRLVSKELEKVGDAVGLATLTYRPAPDALDDQRGHPWGHCLVVQINRNEYENDGILRGRIKEWARQVASTILAGDVLGPFELPTDDEPYRPK
jgi:hypothetical protein